MRFQRKLTAGKIFFSQFSIRFSPKKKFEFFFLTWRILRTTTSICERVGREGCWNWAQKAVSAVKIKNIKIKLHLNKSYQPYNIKF